jgi:hypothetical protein
MGSEWLVKTGNKSPRTTKLYDCKQHISIGPPAAGANHRYILMSPEEFAGWEVAFDRSDIAGLYANAWSRRDG